MRIPAAADDAFGTLYDDVRNRLLLQTWALTGDLAAAQRGVQEAFVVAAHHWRKVRVRPHPATGDGQECQEDWVRPIAWRHAQRRASVPHLHRDDALDEGIRATLTALGRLSATQRKVLLLAHLSSTTIEQLAREVGITKGRAERELQAATVLLAAERDVPSTGILRLFEPMGVVVAQRRWPPTSQLARAGGHRRLSHTVAGAAAALVALTGSGVFVTQQADSQPTLGALSFSETEGPAAPEQEEEAPAPVLEADDLLAPEELDTALSGTWHTEITSDNTGGGGLMLPCQQRSIADPGASAALMRSFVGAGPAHRAGQAVEVSRNPRAAEQAYDRALKWYSGCAADRVQLITTQDVTGLGDRAQLVAVRDWTSPQRSTVVGVSRTGSVTTAVTATLPVLPKAALPRVRTLLSSAVERACALEDAGACVGKQAAEEVAPARIGRHPHLLAEIDLPPVPTIAEPWVGTAPEKAATNQAATRCDNTSFAKPPVARSWTRTFVIPDARGLDPAFGLTETVGTFASGGTAARFVAGVRDRMSSCSERDLVSTVDELGGQSTRAREVTVWRVRVRTSETSTVTYLMAIVRQGDAVAQLGFVPSREVTLSDEQFTDLTTRVAERLTLL